MGIFPCSSAFLLRFSSSFGEVEASDKCLAGVSKNGWTDGAGAGISSATARLAIAERQWLQGSLKDRKLRGSCQCGHGSKGLL